MAWHGMHAVEVGCSVARLIGLTREQVPCTGGGLVASLKQIRVLYTGHTGMQSSPHTPSQHKLIH